MYICYSIDQDTGSVALQYSCTEDGELIQDFKDHEDVKSWDITSVATDAEEYHSEDAYRDLAKHLWTQLGAVRTDGNGADGAIEESFLHFPKGTAVYDIWRWLERECDVSVAKELMAA